MPLSIRVGAVFSTRGCTHLFDSTSELWKSTHSTGIRAVNGRGVLP